MITHTKGEVAQIILDSNNVSECVSRVGCEHCPFSSENTGSPCQDIIGWMGTDASNKKLQQILIEEKIRDLLEIL